MRLKEEQIARLAEKILADLTAANLIALKKERGAALAGIREAIAADIDRHKMLRMIKEKLAKERKIVL